MNASSLGRTGHIRVLWLLWLAFWKLQIHWWWQHKQRCQTAGEWQLMISPFLLPSEGGKWGNVGANRSNSTTLLCEWRHLVQPQKLVCPELSLHRASLCAGAVPCPATGRHHCALLRGVVCFSSVQRQESGELDCSVLQVHREKFCKSCCWACLGPPLDSRGSSIRVSSQIHQCVSCCLLSTG